MERKTSNINYDNEISNEDRYSIDKDDKKNNDDKDDDCNSNNNNMNLDNIVENVKTDTDFVNIVHLEQKKKR